MGWTGHDLPDKKWQLYTRGGTCGVFIRKKGTEEEIEIPSEMLTMLVADDVRSHQIRKLEQCDDNEALGLPKNHGR